MSPGWSRRLWHRVPSVPQSPVWGQDIEGPGEDSLAQTLHCCFPDSPSLTLLGPGLCL